MIIFKMKRIKINMKICKGFSLKMLSSNKKILKINFNQMIEIKNEDFFFFLYLYIYIYIIL
jgi:hypothetical protein